MKKVFFVFIALFICLQMATPNYDSTIAPTVPKIGYPVPDFTTQIEHYSKKTVSPKDFLGKWLIIDFWSEYCSGCIKAFPHMNEIQREFKDNLQIMYVGIKRYDVKTIKLLYEKHRAKLNLKIPISYDSSLAAQFKVPELPHLVIVDPNGIVRYITTTPTKEDIRKIIAGEPVKMYFAANRDEQRMMPENLYNRNAPLLLNGNGGPDTSYLFRSVFVRATNEHPFYVTVRPDKLELLRLSILQLYRFVHLGFVSTLLLPTDTIYGKFWPTPELRVRDSSIFTFDNLKGTENLFSYGVYRKGDFRYKTKSYRLEYQALLKSELEQFFPYVSEIEVQKKPCFIIRLTDSGKKLLKSKATVRKLGLDGGNWQGVKWEMVPSNALVDRLYVMTDFEREIPIFYEGEIIPIDINLKSLYTEDLIKEMKMKGIEVIKSEREIKVIVIRDRN